MSYVIEGHCKSHRGRGRHEQRFCEFCFPLSQTSTAVGHYSSRKSTTRSFMCVRKLENGIEVKDLKKQGYTQAGVWSKKYRVFRFGSSEVVVVGEEGVDVDQLKRPTYCEKVFADIRAIHKDGHHKGNKLFKLCGAIYHNIQRDVCKIFTDTCPICTQETKRKKA
ncbi:hypothetical protein ACHAWO_006261 [Cyclotella atomus]|uniref:Integrase zinc-binding domain-containing protein n=1 Tax=Cyclotella atomus TaxID=382360 RepID=A0ABD3PLV4_9STRA